MIDIPVKIRISLLIEQGSVFNFHVDFRDSKRQSKNRYFVVLNRNPKIDAVLLMITSTTQIAKRKAFVKRVGISEQTIVVVSPKEYSVFSTESAFNCNDVFEVSMQDLIRKIEDTGSMNYPKIPDGILSKLITGVKQSPQVSPAVKALL